MKHTKLLWLLIILFSFGYTPSILSQIVYEPIQNSVYDFLDRLSVKGVINLHIEVKPYSRLTIAELLKEAELKESLLSNLEISDLEFYKKEYFDEFKTVNKQNNNTRSEIFRTGETGRFRLFDYHDSLFSVYIDPVIGYSAESFKSSTLTHFWNGASIFGYISDFIGYSLNFIDNQENGNYLDVTRNFTPLSGIDNVVPTYQGHNSQNTLQHDEVNATITASWSWGSFSFGKDFINVGSSLSPASQLILSSKTPSFPFIELRVSPVSWLRFTYIHGWLYSGLLDSSTIHYSPVSDRQNYTQIPKFIAAHFLSIDFNQNITLSIGESMVYSQNIEPLYLVPIMFFRLADHYLTKDSSNTGSNAQVFADGSIKIPSIKSKFYSTLFIDELSLTSVIENKNGASAVGYTIGAEIIDPLIENSSLVLEYTKISPFVYMNSNIAQTYTSYGYPLGNWIGNNGDITYLQYTQNILRGLKLDLWGDYIKKGSMPAPEQQYELPYPSTLFGLMKIQKEYGLEASYEIINDCWFKLYYSYSNISDQDLTRTPSYLLGTTSSIGLSISYGYNTLSR